MISIFICLLLCCLAIIGWVRALELLGDDDYRPSRKQLREWRRQRLEIERAANKWRHL